MQIFLVVALIIAILAVIFALQNPMPITVSLLAWQFEGSLALVLLIALTLGVLISLLVSVPTVIRRNRAITAQRKTIRELESRLAERDQQKQAPAREQPEQPIQPARFPETLPAAEPPLPDISDIPS